MRNFRTLSIAITSTCLTTQAQSKPCALAFEFIKSQMEAQCSLGSLDSTKQKLSASGKLTLDGIVAKLVNAGFAANSSYEKEETKGPLQQDVAKLIATSMDCKRDVAKKLQADLIGQCDIVCEKLPPDLQPRKVKGDAVLSKLDGNNCCDNGPEVQAHIVPTPNWRLIAQTAHLVPDTEKNSVIGNNRVLYSSEYRVTHNFHATRPDTKGLGGGVYAHLEATEVWDGPCP